MADPFFYGAAFPPFEVTIASFLITQMSDR